jgi:hypothetical protein
MDIKCCGTCAYYSKLYKYCECKELADKDENAVYNLETDDGQECEYYE